MCFTDQHFPYPETHELRGHDGTSTHAVVRLFRDSRILVGLMKHFASGLAFALLAGTASAQPMPPGSRPPVPAELSALVAKAKLGAPGSAWCRVLPQSGRSRAYAVAITSADRGGRYLVVESNATVFELAPFREHADLACYTPAQAKVLNRTIAESETIQGRVTPRWSTTVVCGFVDETTSVCWQYSPAKREFVRVGGWIT